MTFELDEDQAREVAKLRKHAGDIRCAIVGAVALKHHVPLPRHTADVDLVIDLDVAELRALLGGLGWKQHERIEHRWTGPGNFVADALPASSELLKAGKVRLEADTKEMSLAGFDVLFEHAPALPIPGYEQTVQVQVSRLSPFSKSQLGSTVPTSEQRTSTIWGAFSGLRSPTTTNAVGTARCRATSINRAQGLLHSRSNRSPHGSTST